MSLNFSQHIVNFPVHRQYRRTYVIRWCRLLVAFYDVLLFEREKSWSTSTFPNYIRNRSNPTCSVVTVGTARQRLNSSSRQQQRLPADTGDSALSAALSQCVHQDLSHSTKQWLVISTKIVPLNTQLQLHSCVASQLVLVLSIPS